MMPGSASARMSRVRAALDLLDEDVVFALGRGFDGEIFRLDALLAREAGHGLRGRGFGRTQHALLAVGLARGQTLRRAAPGGAGVASSVTDLVRDVELFEQQAQVFERAGDHPIGNLLGADFEQEGKAHCATSAGRLAAADRPRPAPPPPPACARAGSRPRAR